MFNMLSPYNSIPDIPPAMYTSHLNILKNNNTQIKPLWHLNEHHQEYFEIEILTDKSEEKDLPLKKNIDEILNLNKYTCYICNIEVPKTYIKEHNNSIKHKTCNNIANLALDRIKLQTQLDVAVPRKIEILETYFCDPCATVVLNADKEKHEMTKIHKISLKHDELLSDLLKIYVDIENVEVNSEIDELELLRQKIELESLQEESGLQNEETGSFEDVETLDGKVMQEVLGVTKSELKSALHSEFNVVAGKASEVSEFIDRMKIQTAMMHEEAQAIQNKVNEYENNKLDNRIDDFNNQTNMPTRSRNARNKAFKKDQIRNKKERLHKKTHALATKKETKVPENNTDPLQTVENTTTKIAEKYCNTLFEDSNNSTAVTAKEYINDILKDEGDSTAEEARGIENSNRPLNHLTNKIDAILAKYFDSNHTVDALINNTERDKNKTIRELKNKKENNNNKSNEEYINNKEIIEQNPNKIDKERNEDNCGQNEVIEENNINKNIQKQNDGQNRNSIQQSENYKEQNNNKETEQNKNIKHNKKTKDHNKKQDKISIKEHHNVIAKPIKCQAPSFNLINYLKDISRRCQIKPIHTVEALTDTIVQITAINGDKIKVLVNNFHSFHVKTNNIFCKVCESSNVRRPEWHIIENEHRAKVMIPIIDLNGIRQLDEIWSHCILCNDLTKNIDFHLQSLLHKNKLKHCLVELGNNDTSDNEDKIYEEKKQNSTSNKGVIITELILKNNLVMTSKNYLNCVICDVIVNYDLSSVKQHINSFVHLNNFEQQQYDNKLVDVDIDRSYCIACDIHISKSDIVSHCNGKKHKKLLQELLHKQGEVLEEETDETEVVLASISQSVKKQFKGKMDDSELICFVCNTIINFTDEHMDSFGHKKNYYTYLEANKLNEIEVDTFYCIPCNTVITIDYLMSHCTSRKHKQTLNNRIGSGDENKENVQTEKVNNQMLTQVPSTSQIHTVTQMNFKLSDKTMRLKVLYQFREMSDSTKLLCTVCDEEVAYNRKLAEYHVSTLDHVVAFNLMMLWNKIKKRDDKYFCDICRLDMTYFSEITHVLGKQHTVNLAKEPKGTVYEYDRTLVTHAYAMSHKVGDRTRPSSIISFADSKKK